MKRLAVMILFCGGLLFAADPVVPNPQYRADQHYERWDMFAASALEAIIVKEEIRHPRPVHRREHVRAAWSYANAMIHERERQLEMGRKQGKEDDHD